MALHNFSPPSLPSLEQWRTPFTPRDEWHRLPVYSISKAGMNIVMTKFGAELAPDGIKTLSLSPKNLDLSETNVRPPARGVKREANIIIEVPPLPVDWWTREEKEIHSPSVADGPSRLRVFRTPHGPDSSEPLSRLPPPSPQRDRLILPRQPRQNSNLDQ